MFLKQLIDLFKSESPGFRDKEVDVGEAGKIETTPKEGNVGSQVCAAGFRIDHIWGDKCEKPVPEPTVSNYTGCNRSHAIDWRESDDTSLMQWPWTFVSRAF